jgi:hypothetical protein
MKGIAVARHGPHKVKRSGLIDRVRGVTTGKIVSACRLSFSRENYNGNF